VFITSREKARDVLHTIQREHCAYDTMSMGIKPAKAPAFCDCKYGYEGKASKPGYSEQTGCPELRCAVDLFTLMTDDEYAAIMARGHNTLI